MAEKQGKYIAEQLNGKPAQEFTFQGIGMLAYIGGFKAVTDLKAFKDRGQFRSRC